MSNPSLPHNSATEAALQRMAAIGDRIFKEYFSPEIDALIDPDMPEVIGLRGPVWRLRRVRPRKRYANRRGLRQAS